MSGIRIQLRSWWRSATSANHDRDPDPVIWIMMIKFLWLVSGSSSSYDLNPVDSALTMKESGSPDSSSIMIGIHIQLQHWYGFGSSSTHDDPVTAMRVMRIRIDSNKAYGSESDLFRRIVSPYKLHWRFLPAQQNMSEREKIAVSQHARDGPDIRWAGYPATIYAVLVLGWIPDILPDAGYLTRNRITSQISS